MCREAKLVRRRDAGNFWHSSMDAGTLGAFDPGMLSGSGHGPVWAGGMRRRPAVCSCHHLSPGQRGTNSLVKGGCALYACCQLMPTHVAPNDAEALRVTPKTPYKCWGTKATSEETGRTRCFVQHRSWLLVVIRLSSDDGPATVQLLYKHNIRHLMVQHHSAETNAVICPFYHCRSMSKGATDHKCKRGPVITCFCYHPSNVL